MPSCLVLWCQRIDKIKCQGCFSFRTYRNTLITHITKLQCFDSANPTNDDRIETCCFKNTIRQYKHTNTFSERNLKLKFNTHYITFKPFAAYFNNFIKQKAKQVKTVIKHIFSISSA